MVLLMNERIRMSVFYGMEIGSELVKSVPSGAVFYQENSPACITCKLANEMLNVSICLFGIQLMRGMRMAKICGWG